LPTKRTHTTSTSSFTHNITYHHQTLQLSLTDTLTERTTTNNKPSCCCLYCLSFTCVCTPSLHFLYSVLRDYSIHQAYYSIITTTMSVLSSTTFCSAMTCCIASRSCSRSSSSGSGSRRLLLTRRVVAVNNQSNNYCSVRRHSTSTSTFAESTTTTPSFSSSNNNPLARAFRWYSDKLESHPILTKSLTAATIGASGDVLCQYYIDKPEKEKAKANTGEHDTTQALWWFQPERTGRFFLLGAVLVGPWCHACKLLHCLK
jgi:hypothetical protein